MKFNKVRRVHIIFLLITVTSLFAVPVIQAVASVPGSDSDPIVTKSYVDQRVNELAKKIDELTAKVDELSKNGSSETGGAAKFEVIRLTKGQTLIAGDSAEIIVRRGRTEAISGQAGDGLSDITIGGGIDYYTGDEIPENHLLLVARDDGRGLTALSLEVYLLFKGDYEIKN